ncbi:hypothetical protein Pint_29725 [Pistacia integerrima]|uniref:Uncharacterized protein n=1 Tax=Pistacia integerrima TaxID=434235 RepID=A0ACC0X1Z6_9ROSI|nr:hypothetical protein Pint_29725 [Pistacia integerrima]
MYESKTLFVTNTAHSQPKLHEFHVLHFQLQCVYKYDLLEGNFAPITINMADSERNHTALLVIDMQNDFIEDNGLVRMDGGKAILPNVINAVEKARQRGILVIWVVREHDPQGRDVELFRRHFYSTGKMCPACKGSPGVVGANVIGSICWRVGLCSNSELHKADWLMQYHWIINLLLLLLTPQLQPHLRFMLVSNIFDMKNVGVATPTLQEWYEADD